MNNANAGVLAREQDRRLCRRGSILRAVLFILASTVAVVAHASPAAAQTKIVTIQQTSTGRFVDAHESADQDYRIVTRPAQNNRTQQWIMTQIGNTVTFQQVSTGRYWDAHEGANEDFRLVTRPAQSNTTQRWIVTDAGDGTVEIQQASNGRFVYAYGTGDNDFGLFTREPSFIDPAGATSWRIQVIAEVVPADRGDPLVVIPPIGVPRILSEGNFELLPTVGANLDNGNVGGLGSDLGFEFALGNLALAPINGAQISFTDGAERGIATAGIASCATAAFSATAVPLSTITAGDYVCMRTDEGHISEFRVIGIGLILKKLTISYTTWQ